MSFIVMDFIFDCNVFSFCLNHRFLNQEPDEYNATIPEDELQGHSTSMSNGAMEMSPQTAISSSQNKERASGCTVSNKDDSDINDDSISMHKSDPTTNFLNRTEEKSSWHSRSPKPVTANTAKRTHEFLLELAKVIQTLLGVFTFKSCE